MNMWDTLHVQCECAYYSLTSGSLSSLESLLNVNEHSHPVSFHVQATRQKRAKPKTCSARGNIKTAPKQEKITNARVLLRANDVRGVQMKSHSGLARSIFVK
jgi:hypothetical protein